MIERILIVRGVRATSELQALGLPMAQKYEAADKVILVGDDGRGLVVKGSKSTTVAELIDTNSRAGRIAQQLKRIHCGFMEDHPEDAHLAHEKVGLFLFFWFAGGTTTVIERINEGHAQSVEKAADVFIDSDYGANPPAPDTISANGNSVEIRDSPDADSKTG